MIQVLTPHQHITDNLLQIAIYIFKKCCRLEPNTLPHPFIFAVRAVWSTLSKPTHVSLSHTTSKYVNIQQSTKKANVLNNIPHLHRNAKAILHQFTSWRSPSPPCLNPNHVSSASIQSNTSSISLPSDFKFTIRISDKSYSLVWHSLDLRSRLLFAHLHQPTKTAIFLKPGDMINDTKCVMREGLPCRAYFKKFDGIG